MKASLKTTEQGAPGARRNRPDRRPGIGRRVAALVVVGSCVMTGVAGGAAGAEPTEREAITRREAAAVPSSPEPPTGVHAVAGDRSATVTWAAPTQDGGQPVLGYVVGVADGPGVSVAGDVLTATLPGLTNGSSYAVSVRAVNRLGVSTPASAAAVTPTPIITTFAGTGTAGYTGDGGQAASAQLKDLRDVTVDGQDNVYISANGGIRKISAAGVISTVVTAAQVNPFYPGSIAGSLATGPDDELYWATRGAVLKLQDGTITIVAGIPDETEFTGDGGPADAAALGWPQGLAVAGNGDVFIADGIHARIRRVSNGIISTVAGSGLRGFEGDGGPATSARLSSPSGIAITPDGTMYIGDSSGHRVRMVVDGIITTVAGNGTEGKPAGDGGPATQATVQWPIKVIASPDGIMIGAAACVIREVVDGVIDTVAGAPCALPTFSGDGGPAIGAHLGDLNYMALDPNGRLFLADSNYRIRMVSTFAQPPAAVAPSAPFGVLATPGHEQVEISWVPPTNGGSPVTGYRVTAQPGGAVVQAAATSTSVTVPNLGHGTTYTFTVQAVNAVGTGPASGGQAATPTRGPSAPTAVSATGGDGQALVTWSPAVAGSGPITGYRVVSSPGGVVALAPATASRVLVPGLATTTSYRFTVAAVDADGIGPASVMTLAVTPAATAPFRSTDAFILQVFADFLGRAPSTQQLIGLRAEIDSGRLTRALLVVVVMADRTWADVYAPVGRLYFAYFRRLPDTAGLDYWVGHLRQGLPLGNISALFAESDEFRETYARLGNADFARLVYRNVLGRVPDQGGLVYWVGLMDRGYPRGAVMTGFSESTEYRSAMANEIDVVLLWRGMLGSVPNGATHVDAVARLDAAVALTTLADELLLDPGYAAHITR